MTPAAILDVDGTLVDSNYQHAIAWFRAFREHGVTPPIWRIHRHIGMGGDQLVGAVAGDEVEAEHGDAIRDGEGRCYAELIGEVCPFEGAAELIATLAGCGIEVVLASSAKEDEVERYIELLGCTELISAYTTSDAAGRRSA
jgi:phosphoglycolate phosphatase-like HAD superfamily hydrolase